jgi:CheY-like chemotaxis protein
VSSDSAPPTEPSSEPDAAELGRCVRDLVACTALPALWAGKTAANVDEALRILRGAPFGVVLTDLSMPARDGFDLLDHLRGQLPVVAVTAAAGTENATALVDAVGDLVGRARRPA